MASPAQPDDKRQLPQFSSGRQLVLVLLGALVAVSAQLLSDIYKMRRLANGCWLELSSQVWSDRGGYSVVPTPKSGSPAWARLDFESGTATFSGDGVIERTVALRWRSIYWSRTTLREGAIPTAFEFSNEDKTELWVPVDLTPHLFVAALEGQEEGRFLRLLGRATPKVCDGHVPEAVPEDRTL